MSNQENKTKVLASIGLLGAAVIWGFAFVIVKNSLDLIPAVYMLAFRFSIAAIAVGIIFRKRLKNLRKETLYEGMILGFFLFAGYLVQTVGCKYTTAGKNAFLTTVYVVIVPFLNWAMNKKKPDVYCITAAFLAVFGIGLLSLQGDLSINIGDVLTLICGIGYALHMIFIDRFTDRHDPVLLTILQLFFAAVFSWMAVPFIGGGFPKEAFNPQIIIAMLYLGLLSSALGFLLQTVGQKYTTAGTASLLLSMEAVFGVVFSAIFLKEVMTSRMLVGCVFILGAIVLAETKLEFLPWFKKEQKC